VVVVVPWFFLLFPSSEFDLEFRHPGHNRSTLILLFVNLVALAFLLWTEVRCWIAKHSLFRSSNEHRSSRQFFWTHLVFDFWLWDFIDFDLRLHLGSLALILTVWVQLDFLLKFACFCPWGFSWPFSLWLALWRAGFFFSSRNFRLALILFFGLLTFRSLDFLNWMRQSALTWAQSFLGFDFKLFYFSFSRLPLRLRM